MRRGRFVWAGAVSFIAACLLDLGMAAGLQSSDLFKLRSVGAVQLSPDGSRVAYTVSNSDETVRPYSQIWILDIASGKSTRFGGEKDRASNPVWSPDGQWIAYSGRDGASGKSGLMVARPDGSAAR